MEIVGAWFGDDDRRSFEVDLALRFLSPIADDRLEGQESSHRRDFSPEMTLTRNRRRSTKEGGATKNM